MLPSRAEGNLTAFRAIYRSYDVRYVECKVHPIIYRYTMMYQTQQNFMFIIVLGQHVSILIESSSGTTKI